MRSRLARRRTGAWAALVCLMVGVAPPALRADAYQERRARTGIRLFRALLAADLELERKTATDGRLLVLFFHTGDRDQAEEWSRVFAGNDPSGATEPIRGLPVTLETTDDESFARYLDGRPAGIFLAQNPPAAVLRAIVRYGIANHVIVYSPYEGHVEDGVLGGLVVEAQVRPFINLTTLKASKVSLKEFFLKVTRVYE